MVTDDDIQHEGVRHEVVTVHHRLGPMLAALAFVDPFARGGGLVGGLLVGSSLRAVQVVLGSPHGVVPAFGPEIRVILTLCADLRCWSFHSLVHGRCDLETTTKSALHFGIEEPCPCHCVAIEAPVRARLHQRQCFPEYCQGLAGVVLVFVQHLQ